MAKCVNISLIYSNRIHFKTLQGKIVNRVGIYDIYRMHVTALKLNLIEITGQPAHKSFFLWDCSLSTLVMSK
jgi:hypothetical protein